MWNAEFIWTQPVTHHLCIQLVLFSCMTDVLMNQSVYLVFALPNKSNSLRGWPICLCVSSSFRLRLTSSLTKYCLLLLHSPSLSLLFLLLRPLFHPSSLKLSCIDWSSSCAGPEACCRLGERKDAVWKVSHRVQWTVYHEHFFGVFFFS